MGEGKYTKPNNVKVAENSLTYPLAAERRLNLTRSEGI